MIFLTVGTQLPFDRLVRTVDQWAVNSPDEVFGQIGNGRYKPVNFGFSDYLEAKEFESKFNQCKLVISHAGMGSILCALSGAKPILIMPRKASLGEHRNDHQMATAKRFKERGSFPVAMDEEELYYHLTQIANVCAPQRISKFAPQNFIDRLVSIIGVSPRK